MTNRRDFIRLFNTCSHFILYAEIHQLKYNYRDDYFLEATTEAIEKSSGYYTLKQQNSTTADADMTIVITISRHIYWLYSIDVSVHGHTIQTWLNMLVANLFHIPRREGFTPGYTAQHISIPHARKPYISLL
jgi:hypothetical protein